MEANRLDIAGKEQSSELLPSSYKKIPEGDIEKGVAMSKPEQSCSDEAEEKMLPKDGLKSGKIDTPDVKFISNEKQNGDAKVDIGDGKITFSGMAKEELMRYANDPFWVRLRWIMFISFWLLWLLMLIGAIAIIIAAPKCAPPAPRTWWQQGPIAEAGSNPGQQILDELNDQGAKGIIISMTHVDAYSPPDENIVSLIQNIDSMYIIELRPGSSNRWMNESKSSDFYNYYIWASKSNTDGGPPNNWLSPNGGSAWRYSGIHDQYYLAMFGEPNLNFRNPNVIKEFSNVIESWLKIGAHGISLIGADRLLFDEKLRNEEVGANIPGVEHDNYQFYTHKYTKNQEGIGTVLAEWKKIILNATNNGGVLMLGEDINSLEPYKLNGTLQIDLPRNSGMFNLSDRPASAPLFYNGIASTEAMLGGIWPAWKYVAGSLTHDVLDILTILLPGTSIVGNNVIDPLLLQARNSPSVMFGTFNKYLLNNFTVFAYSRVKSGNPGYLVVCNPSDTNATVNFTSEPEISKDLTVYTISKNYDVGTVKPKMKVLSNAIPVPSGTGIVLTYVPKSE